MNKCYNSKKLLAGIAVAMCLCATPLSVYACGDGGGGGGGSAASSAGDPGASSSGNVSNTTSSSPASTASTSAVSVGSGSGGNSDAICAVTNCMALETAIQAAVEKLISVSYSFATMDSSLDANAGKLASNVVVKMLSQSSF